MQGLKEEKKGDSISHNTLKSVSLLCQSHLEITTTVPSKQLYMQFKKETAPTQVLPPLQMHRQLHFPCAYRSKDNLHWVNVGSGSRFISTFSVGWKYISPHPGRSCTVSPLYGFVSCGLLNLASQHFSSLCHFTDGFMPYTCIKPVFLHRLRSRC